MADQAGSLRQQRSFSNHRQPFYGPQEFVPPPSMPPQQDSGAMNQGHHGQRASMHPKRHSAKHRASGKNVGSYNEQPAIGNMLSLDSGIVDDVNRTYDDEHAHDHLRFDSMASNDSEAEFQQQLM